MRTRILVFLGFYLLLMSQAARSQTQEKKAVEVSATLNTKVCVVGEPVYLTLEFRNTTSIMKEFRIRLSFYGDVTVQIQFPNKYPIQYRGINQPTILPYYVFEILPLKTERVSLPLFYSEEGPEGLIFDRPVTVPLTVSIEGFVDSQKVKYDFPPFQLEVKEPSEKDRAALGFLKKKSLIYDIHQGRCSRENIATFETYLKQFPDSVYTPYVLFALANSYMANTPKPDYTRAITLFQEYIERYPKTILTDDAVYKIGDCYNSLENKKMAKQRLFKLYYEYPQSNRLNYYDPLMKEHVFIPREIRVSDDLWMLKDTSMMEGPIESEKIPSSIRE